MYRVNFYSELKSLGKFEDVASEYNYIEVPEDWVVLITDVVGSTKAIEAGRYKDVNLIGASTIIALQNAFSGYELPFIFGGDGAMMLVPNEFKTKAVEVLQGVQQMSSKAFGLQVRAAAIPVSFIKQKLGDEHFKIAKLFISDFYSQAVFWGRGVDLVESLLKDPIQTQFDIVAKERAQADFTGLECRWKDIPSRHGEIVSLIIKAKGVEYSQLTKVYQQVIAKLEQIYDDSASYQPVLENELQLTVEPAKLAKEVKVKTDPDLLIYWSELLKIWLVNIVGKIQEYFKLTKLFNFSLPDKKRQVIISTDFKKFDNSLKMVFASNQQRRQQLQDFLDKLEAEEKITYGIQVSDKALMTCLVFGELGKEVHFVDGANGGYALAAKNLKSKLG
ncbi:MAG: DUF3095 domain-containing protein [Patescibacteria group bacterium]